MSNWTKGVVVAAVVASTVACDRTSKLVVERELAAAPIRSYFADTLRLQYSENPGAFLSLGAGLPDRVRKRILVGGAAIMLAAVGITLARRTTKGWAALGLSLLLAGGVSNLIDRILRGTVIDFLNVGIGPVRTGIFNLADVAITVGVAFVVMASSRGWRAWSGGQPRPTNL